MQIDEELKALRDEDFQTFQARLLPTLDSETILGVRTPQLRALAKRLAQNEDETRAFLAVLPHRLFEENQLHAFLLEMCRDYDTLLPALWRFLPFVDNWATCDQLNPKALPERRADFLPQIRKMLADPHPYTVRFGLKKLKDLFLTAPYFSPEILELAASVQSREYYVEMMQAWFFEEAMVKQYDAALPYLSEHRLSPSVHAKTLAKIRESALFSARFL